MFVLRVLCASVVSVPNRASIVEVNSAIPQIVRQRFGRGELHGVEADGPRAGDMAGDVVDEEDVFRAMAGQLGGGLKDRGVEKRG